MTYDMDSNDIVRAARAWLAGHGVSGADLDAAQFVFRCNHKKGTFGLRVILGAGKPLPKILSLPRPVDHGPGLRSVVDDAAGDVELAERRV